MLGCEHRKKCVHTQKCVYEAKARILLSHFILTTASYQEKSLLADPVWCALDNCFVDLVSLRLRRAGHELRTQGTQLPQRKITLSFP